MSKQQAILETLLGVAELIGNRTIAHRIRQDIEKMGTPRSTEGYQRFAFAAVEPKNVRRKAA